MLTFLFENYGYYPNEFVNDSFFINDWQFKLFKVDYLNDKQLDEIEKYIVYIRNSFDNKGPYLIKTRNGQNYSFYDGNRYVLVCVYKCNLNVKDLNKMHVLFKEEYKKIDLSNLLKLWIERINYIETEGINQLKYSDVNYKKIFESSMFFLGMGVNAVQYLSEIIIDYGKEIDGLSLVHVRLNELDSFEILNPFNLIIDHPIRDLAELYKKDLLQYQDFLLFLDYYKIDSKIASLLMCKILYNYEMFDTIAESTKKKIDFNLEREMMKVKKIYKYLKDKYNIRPIDWLEY